MVYKLYYKIMNSIVPDIAYSKEIKGATIRYKYQE